MRPRIYLDHNASAPLCAEARAATLRWLDLPANTHAVHASGRAAHQAVDEARGAVAALWGVDPRGVVFTSGATEANALALGTDILSVRRWAGSSVEHPSVRAWVHRELAVDQEGRVLAESLDDLDVDGVSIQLANNETGVVQDLAALAARARARGLRVHVDASQAPGRIDLAALRLADAVTLSSHKIGGPQGVGALVLARLPDRAEGVLLRGGPQERGLRAGTHPVATVAGFGAAARRVSERLAGAAGVAALRDRLEAGLRALGGRVAGGGAARLPNTACVGFVGRDAAMLVLALDLEGIEVSAGAACASGSQSPGHVLAAMGFLADTPGGAVRFSLGPETTADEVARCLHVVGHVLARMDADDAHA
jgi:cysteine desulfurase